MEKYPKPHISDYSGSESASGVDFLKRQISRLESEITGLKESIAELESSEQKFRQFVQMLPEVVFEIDPGGRITFFNDNAMKATGYGPEDIAKGLDVVKLFVPEDRARAAHNMKHILDGGQNQGNTYTAISKSGEKINVLVHSSPIMEKGRITKIRGIAVNITDKIKLQKELEKQRDFVKSILETANSLIVCLDSQANIVVFNHQCEIVTGYKREEVLGKHWPTLFVPREFHPPPDVAFADWVRRNPEDQYEQTISTKSGESKTILWSNSAIIDPDSNEVTAIAIGHDITESKAVEAALKESQQLYQTIWRNSPIGISLSDIDGIYHYVNPAYCKIYGYTESELIGKNFFDLIVTPELRDKPLDDYRMPFKKGVPLPSGDAEFVRKDGTRIWVRHSSDFVRLDGKPLFLITMNIDITEEKLAEQELKNSKLRFEAQFKASPVPLYSWRKVGKDFILIDYNFAAERITQGGIKNWLGVKLTDLYAERPELIADVDLCFNTGQAFTRELKYRFKSTSEEKYLLISYTSAPPDIVLVHTTDITQSRINQLRSNARLKLLTNLRDAASVNQCLKYGCEAFADAELYKRAVLTLHNEKREIIHIGYVGVDKELIKAARRAPAPDEELARQMMQDKYRISSSYFIPAKSGLPIQEQARYVPQTNKSEVSEIAWKTGDELFVPVYGGKDIIIGWLSVDTPLDGNRPTLETILFLEETVDIVIKKVQSLQSLKQLKKERHNLENKNIAFKKLFETIEEQKLQFRKQISDTVDVVLLPALEKIIDRDGSVNAIKLQALRKSLQELGTSAGKELKAYLSLSGREAYIFRLIKGGATSKDIAFELNVTLGTVQKHREKIRKKLGLTGKKINLANYIKNI